MEMEAPFDGLLPKQGNKGIQVSSHGANHFPFDYLNVISRVLVDTFYNSVGNYFI